MPTARSVIYLLALGAVSWVFSEGMFWAHRRPDQSVADVAMTWLAYTVIGCLALAAARYASVSTVAGLFLVGALYGWLIEGAVAGTAFDQVPLQISWTGLAWHASLTVCLGWYALPVALRQGTPRDAVLVVGGLGLGFGLWAAGYVHDEEVVAVPSNGAFATYAAGLALVLALAYPICDRLAPPPTRMPGRRPVVVAGLITCAWFALGVVPTRPWGAVMLPILLAVPLLPLRAAARRGDRARGPLLARPARPVRLRRLAWLALLPVVAATTYALTEPFVGRAPTIATYVITLPGGVVALVWSVRRVRRLGA